MGFWKKQRTENNPDIRPVLLSRVERKLLAALCVKQGLLEKAKHHFNSPLPQLYHDLQHKLLAYDIPETN